MQISGIGISLRWEGDHHFFTKLGLREKEERKVKDGRQKEDWLAIDDNHFSGDGREKDRVPTMIFP